MKSGFYLSPDGKNIIQIKFRNIFSDRKYYKVYYSSGSFYPFMSYKNSIELDIFFGTWILLK